MLERYETLIARAEKVAQYNKISLSTLGTKACKNGAVFAQILKGGSVTGRIEDRIKEYLDEQERIMKEHPGTTPIDH